MHPLSNTQHDSKYESLAIQSTAKKNDESKLECRHPGRFHPGHFHEVIIDSMYLDLIKRGQKTVEGKVNKPKYAHIKKGDIIKFVSSTLPKKTCFCKVKDRVSYESFKHMLEGEGLQNCLPGLSTIEEGIRVYHSFPGYATDELIYQVAAFKIIVISQELI